MVSIHRSMDGWMDGSMIVHTTGPMDLPVLTFVVVTFMSHTHTHTHTLSLSPMDRWIDRLLSATVQPTLLVDARESASLSLRHGMCGVFRWSCGWVGGWVSGLVHHSGPLNRYRCYFFLEIHEWVWVGRTELAS